VVQRRTIWLVGMMGAGKSSVAAELGARLGLPVFDTDALVEAEAGMRIPEIFAREGEAGFRARERRAIAVLAGRAAVVALGGGAIAQAAVAEELAAGGTIVYLRARPETLAERVGSAASRPLLAGLDAGGRRAKLAALLADRRCSYERADRVVDTDERSVREVADAVAEALFEASA
jgi:shikimate kinase